MQISRHALIGTVIAGAALFVSVPVFISTGASHPITTEKLTVDPNEVRPTLATAERALGPITAKFSGMSDSNPFALRERGGHNATAIPEPPPPQLTLPDPPRTPFAPTH